MEFSTKLIENPDLFIVLEDKCQDNHSCEQKFDMLYKIIEDKYIVDFICSRMQRKITNLVDAVWEIIEKYNEEP